MKNRIYKIEFTEDAIKSSKKLPKSIWAKIKDKILSLQNNPFPNGYKRLRNFDNIYRIRFSTYRIIYAVKDEKRIIVIINVGHRKEVYAKF